MYEITSDVPMPTASKYPFGTMQIGDSFAVPVPPGADAGAHAAALRSRCFSWGKKNGLKFTVRLYDARTAARVWRVA